MAKDSAVRFHGPILAIEIESTFGTTRHRTDRAKGCVTQERMRSFIYKLGMCAEKRRRRIRGFNHLAKMIR